MNTPVCRDCRYVDDVVGYLYCKHLQSSNFGIDPDDLRAYGGENTPPARFARMAGAPCGPDAKLFVKETRWWIKLWHKIS